MDQFDSLWGVKGDQISYELNYNINLESWYTPEVGQWRCSVGLVSQKQTDFGLVLCSGMDKKLLVK